MLKIVETFSGIGAQAKALRNIGVEFEVVNTVEWDINAICAYDIIHNGPQQLDKYLEMSKEELIKSLSKFQLSQNGKVPLEKKNLSRMRIETLRRILAAIERSKNLVSITDVKESDLPGDIDVLTYSFPCQDLSTSGFWHGNKGGIDKNANNRSSMLWQIERILMEFQAVGKDLPKFLLMENVTSIHSPRHIDNFNLWKDYLKEAGYYNKMYDLKATNFGIPQNRTRTFLLSVYCENEDVYNHVHDYFEKNNLELYKEKCKPLSEFLRLNYKKKSYLNEAKLSIPNNTKSRKAILEKNPHIVDKEGNISQGIVRTITTKQDRHPNSGVLYHGINDENMNLEHKAEFRYLTPRECFMLMGFDESDYQSLLDNNFKSRSNGEFFTFEKTIKMAGNSIVVNILEELFKQILDIKENVL